jgi:hypothetical protein
MKRITKLCAAKRKYKVKEKKEERSYRLCEKIKFP